MTVLRCRNSSSEYLFNDHLGTPVVSAASNGNIRYREVFTPFGEVWGASHANTIDQDGFTGHIRDTDTGLTYMQARYYDPVIGRFLGNDPVGFAEGGPDYFNRYSYTANNPVNMIDPDGRQIVGASDREGLAIYDQASKSSSTVSVTHDLSKATGVSVLMRFGDTNVKGQPVDGAATEGISVDGKLAQVVVTIDEKDKVLANGDMVTTFEGGGETRMPVTGVPLSMGELIEHELGENGHAHDFLTLGVAGAEARENSRHAVDAGNNARAKDAKIVSGHSKQHFRRIGHGGTIIPGK